MARVDLNSISQSARTHLADPCHAFCLNDVSALFKPSRARGGHASTGPLQKLPELKHKKVAAACITLMSDQEKKNVQRTVPEGVAIC